MERKQTTFKRSFETEVKGHTTQISYLVDGEVAGSCKVGFYAPYAHIKQIRSEREGEGVGSALLSEIERLAREQGIPRVWGIVVNPEVKEFYEKNGYTAQPRNDESFYLRKELD